MEHKEHIFSRSHSANKEESVTSTVKALILDKLNASRGGASHHHHHQPPHTDGDSGGNSTSPGGGSSSGGGFTPGASNLHDGKQRVAVKIASALPTSGSPAKIITAFIQVGDYVGLDRYLSKNEVKREILNYALQKACISSNADAVRVLASHGADVRFADQFGTTMLHFAMRGGGNSDVIESLVEHNVQYEEWNSEGSALIHWACQREHIDLVKLLVSKNTSCLDLPDENGRLPIHVAATYGRPSVLCYLLECHVKQLSPRHVNPAYKLALQNPEDEANKSREKEISEMRRIAAANYLDEQGWTPLHHANTEEASNDYSACMQMLLDEGADLMLQTPQGKTALDLAYGAGRSKVLIDILPTDRMLRLLQRIDDIVPRSVRKQIENRAQQAADRRSSTIDQTLTPTSQVPVVRTSFVQSGPDAAEENSLLSLSPKDSVGDSQLIRGSRFGYSIIRRAINSKNNTRRSMVDSRVCPWESKEETAQESLQMLSLWRRILLNDDVELLEMVRDSLIWRKTESVETFQHCGGDTSDRRRSSVKEKKSVDDFESAQCITKNQLVDLFHDCYENGIGVYSHVQSIYGQLIKTRGMRTLLRALTGLDTFNHLVTMEGVIIFRPLHGSLLFLAVICGRFRVAEALLRMRQFDILPTCVLVALIIRRLYTDPQFPEQMRNELEIFASVAESIAVDVLSQVYLKDITVKKATCREFLNVPLRSFGDQTVVDLCAVAKCAALLSLPCCQRVLDQRWDGVLSYLPYWLRASTRFIPLTGLIYLERKTKAQQTKALLECINMTATSSTPIYSEVKRSVTDKSPTQPRGTLLSFSNDNNRRAPPADKSNWSSKCRRPVTVFDEMKTEFGWTGSPRFNFLLAVFDSPSVKFMYHSIFHLAFVLLFSVLLVTGIGDEPGKAERASLTYVIGYMFEEMRQFAIECLRHKVLGYLTDMWNWVDILGIFTIVASGTDRFGTRFTTCFDDKTPNARYGCMYPNLLLYSCGLTLFYIRTLYLTSIFRKVGPRLKMMYDMLKKDLLPMLIVFIIFIVSFGVVFFVLRNQQTDQPVAKIDVVDSVLLDAFYAIFEVDSVREVNATARNLGTRTVDFVFLVVYTGAVNVILINLLIALFSNTVSRIDQRSTAHWLADRHQMVMEYQDRSILPPPFNILSILVEVCQCLFRHCRAFYRAKQNHRRASNAHGNFSTFIKEDFSSESDDEDSHGGPESKEEMLMAALSRGVAKQADAKKKKKKRLQEEIFMTERDRSRYKGAKTREAEIALRFILVQSFSVKDKRYALGYLSANKSQQPSHQISGNHENTGPSQIGGHGNANINERLREIERKLEKVMDAVLEIPRSPMSLSQLRGSLQHVNTAFSPRKRFEVNQKPVGELSRRPSPSPNRSAYGRNRSHTEFLQRQSRQ